MRANDFRLGNLYHFEDVSGMVVERVDYIENNMVDVNPMDLIHPIPLTEEWLLKFGFYKNIDTELFEKGGYQIDLSVLKCHFYLPDFGDWYKELEYVHQLQNLYFALTGEELTLQES